MTFNIQALPPQIKMAADGILLFNPLSTQESFIYLPLADLEDHYEDAPEIAHCRYQMTMNKESGNYIVLPQEMHVIPEWVMDGWRKGCWKLLFVKL